ncbi:Nub1 [Symbiodinium microadriaticum]|nr:Nub1 [Symbiodinium sp. KB8]CAE7308398.1 Nub1 [Symbiodinium microadriaticum]
MGFTEAKARDALDGCSGNLERAASGISKLGCCPSRRCNAIAPCLWPCGYLPDSFRESGTRETREEGRPLAMGSVLSDPCCGNGSGDDSTETRDVVPALVPSAEIPARLTDNTKLAGPKPKAKKPRKEDIKTLKDMGFEEVAAKNALEATNGNLDQAMQLLLSTVSPEPAPPTSPRSPPARAAPTPTAPVSSAMDEKIATLVGMGFTDTQSRNALDGCSGNVERAVEYLMASGE